MEPHIPGVRPWRTPGTDRHVQAPSPSSFFAFSIMIFGRTSSRKGASAKSLSQRSGLITGKSEPNSTLSWSRVLAYWIREGEKYFAEKPERSMYTFALCIATDNISSCQGQEGCAP